VSKEFGCKSVDDNWDGFFLKQDLLESKYVQRVPGQVTKLFP
jgi:hypothetical protein